ncbi:MAG: AMP-binding enzyme, partial [Planctomycetota bacterium]
QHEAVLESAAIGIPDEKWGERPLVIITLKPEFKGKVSAEDFKQYMKKCVQEGKLPKYTGTNANPCLPPAQAF